MRASLWLLLSLFVTAISWIYVTTVAAPWEHYVNVERGTMKSQMGDLYPSWYGTRELLYRGRNPYGPEVSDEIQMAYYGRVLHQKYDQPGVPVVDEQRFAYPVYIVFLLAPAMRLNFSQLQAWAPVILAILTSASVLLWLDVLRWRPPPAVIAAIVLFVLSSPQVAQGLRLRQLGLLVSFLLAMGTWCISRNHLVAAGVVLALATLKPQMAVLPLIWFLIWSLNSQPRRWGLLASFGITLAALVGMGEIILPAWPRYFLNGMLAYRHYSPTISPLTLILGGPISAALSIIVVVGLLALAWKNRHVDAVSGKFVFTLASLFTAETLVMPLLSPFNQVLLLLPLLRMIRDWSVLPRAWRSVFAVIVIWPWITSLVLLLYRLPTDSLNRTPLLPGAMALLLPFFFALLQAKRNPREDPPLPPGTHGLV
jgi:hypothetical protein